MKAFWVGLVGTLIASFVPVTAEVIEQLLRSVMVGIGIAQLLDDANMFLWKLILAMSFGILLAMVFRWLPSE